MNDPYVVTARRERELLDRIEFLEDRLKHHRFCSAGGWPCPIHCETWEPLIPDARRIELFEISTDELEAHEKAFSGHGFTYPDYPFDMRILAEIRRLLGIARTYHGSAHRNRDEIERLRGLVPGEWGRTYEYLTEDNDALTTIIKQVLAWCETTGSDILSTFDITDEQWNIVKARFT